MAIISISRQLGSLGSKIAKNLQEELGYNYLDKESLEHELVNKYGVPEEKVKRYDEKKPAFWEMFSSDKDRYLYFLKTTMYEFARKGHCVIIGRGGQVLFQDIPGTFHIRIIAPLKLRLERIKERYNYNDHLAEQIVQQSDQDRAGFHKFFFHVNPDDSQLYDLTINTQNLTVESAVQVIKMAINSTGIMDQQPEKNSKLADLCLGQKVYTQIVYTEKIPIQFLKVVANDGIVTLQGAMTKAEDVSRCGKVANNIPEVKKVMNELHYIPTAYGRR